jgi:DnaJ-class molecular chaperone
MSHWQRLGLAETASPDEVEAKWKQLRSEHHPDKGGDAQVFNQLNLAYKAALAEAREPKPCTYCNGSGNMEIRRGFGKVSLMCSVCCGTGLQE